MRRKINAIIFLTFFLPKFGMSQIPEQTRIVKFNGISLNVPSLPNYNFFDNSKYRNQSMSDFTMNSSNPQNEIVELEILVPNNSDPLIQIYSFQEFNDLKVTLEGFNEYKKFIKNNVVPSKYDSLSKEFFKDSLVINKLGNIKSNYSITETIFEKENRLVIGMLIKGQVNEKIKTLSIISNYLYINQTIILIRFTLTKQPSIMKAFLDFQESYIQNILNKN
jgi:hypothetical protein